MILPHLLCSTVSAFLILLSGPSVVGPVSTCVLFNVDNGGDLVVDDDDNDDDDDDDDEAASVLFEEFRMTNSTIAAKLNNMIPRKVPFFFFPFQFRGKPFNTMERSSFLDHMRKLESREELILPGQNSPNTS